MIKYLPAISKFILELIAFGLASLFNANAQTSVIPETFHKILGDAGISRSQFLNGAVIDKTDTGSISQAERWYEAAAAQGHKGALGNLAILLYCGDKRPLDSTRSILLLKDITETGSAPAPWLIGISYFFGDSIPQDYAQSIPWLELSARRGNPYAVQLLIKIYGEGLGTPKSEEKLIWWLRFAANHGDKRSQVQLAEYLATAPEGKRNLVASYFWLISAQDEGASVDKKLLEKVEANINPNVAEVIRLGIKQSGQFRWSNWDEESLVGAYIFPCMRHLDNPLLSQLSVSN